MVHTGRAKAPTRFKLYPVYKDSGVEWLGEIPAHWEARRLKYAAPTRVEKLSTKPEVVAYVGLENVESWTGRLLLDNQPETVDSVVAAFSSGDVLFGKLRPYLAKAARPDFDGVCTSEILPLRPADDNSQSFVMYCLLNVMYVRWLDSLTYGTKMPRVSPEQVNGSFIPVPPPPEQSAIASFLDRETARIDALVAKKERLIELLQEKRTALITRAVTKGLDPTVPMKDSGVEWLGEIPAHWMVKRVRQSCSRVTDGAHISPDTSSPDFHFVSTVNLRGGTIDFDGCLRTSASSYAYMEKTGCRPRHGDVLFSKDGTVGTTAVVATDREFAVASSLVILSPDQEDLDVRWLNYWLNGEFIKDQVELLLSGAALRRISVAKVGCLPLLLPPKLDEQCAIAAFLDRETARIDTLIAKVREAIERLKELRTALISAAVTGKIDVRHTA